MQCNKYINEIDSNFSSMGSGFSISCRRHLKLSFLPKRALATARLSSFKSHSVTEASSANGVLAR